MHIYIRRIWFILFNGFVALSVLLGFFYCRADASRLNELITRQKLRVYEASQEIGPSQIQELFEIKSAFIGIKQSDQDDLLYVYDPGNYLYRTSGHLQGYGNRYFTLQDYSRQTDEKILVQNQVPDMFYSHQMENRQIILDRISSPGLLSQGISELKPLRAGTIEQGTLFFISLYGSDEKDLPEIQQLLGLQPVDFHFDQPSILDAFINQATTLDGWLAMLLFVGIILVLIWSLSVDQLKTKEEHSVFMKRSAFFSCTGCVTGLIISWLGCFQGTTSLRYIVSLFIIFGGIMALIMKLSKRLSIMIADPDVHVEWSEGFLALSAILTATYGMLLIRFYYLFDHYLKSANDYLGFRIPSILAIFLSILIFVLSVLRISNLLEQSAAIENQEYDETIQKWGLLTVIVYFLLSLFYWDLEVLTIFVIVVPTMLLLMNFETNFYSEDTFTLFRRIRISIVNIQKKPASAK